MTAQQEKQYQQLKAQINLDNVLEVIWGALFNNTDLTLTVIPTREAQVRLNAGWLTLGHSLETLGLYALERTN